MCLYIEVTQYNRAKYFTEWWKHSIELNGEVASGQSEISLCMHAEKFQKHSCLWWQHKLFFCVCMTMIVLYVFCLTESKSNRVSAQDYPRPVPDTVGYRHAGNAVPETQDDCSYQKDFSQWNDPRCVNVHAAVHSEQMWLWLAYCTTSFSPLCFYHFLLLRWIVC